MSAITKIEWTDRTWNVVRGCSVISPGCVNCYAMKQGHRFSGPGKAYHGLTKLTKAGPQWTGKVVTVENALLEPLSWRKPQRVFVNSMSDLFHDGVSSSFIAAVFGVMAATPHHTYQILTKRPERMREWFAWAAAQDPEPWTHCHWEALRRDNAREQLHRYDAPVEHRPWPLPNVWLGVSVEDQQRANERIPQLLQTPAAVRFISAEPLLGPLALSGPLTGHDNGECPVSDPDCLGGDGDCHDACEPQPRLDWVIVGGESGPGARPFDLAWGRSIVQQCQSAGVPVFVKQIGAKPVAMPYNTSGWVWTPTEPVPWPLLNKKGGDPAEWPEDLRVREFPAA